MRPKRPSNRKTPPIFDFLSERIVQFTDLCKSFPLLFKTQLFLCAWVGKDEAMAKKSDGAAIVCAVFPVSKQGVTAVRKLYADLMGSSGVQAHAGQAISTVFGGLGATENLIVQNCLFDSLSLAIHHKGFIAVAIVKEQIGQGCARCLWLTVDQCQILFLKGVRLHRCR